MLLESLGNKDSTWVCKNNNNKLQHIHTKIPPPRKAATIISRERRRLVDLRQRPFKIGSVPYKLVNLVVVVSTWGVGEAQWNRPEVNFYFCFCWVVDIPRAIADLVQRPFVISGRNLYERRKPLAVWIARKFCRATISNFTLPRRSEFM